MGSQNYEVVAKGTVDKLRARVAELEAVAKELVWQGDVAITGLSEFGQVRNFEALQLALDNAHNLIDEKDTP